MHSELPAWSVEHSEHLHREPWRTVRRDSVSLNNGHIIPNYYVLEFPNWVNCIAITDDGKFVMVRQYRHGLQQTNYELCAGVAEPSDPSPLISAHRELLEETGFGGGNWEEWTVLSPNPATHNNLTYTFLATGVKKISHPKLDAGEELSVHLMSFDELKELLISGGIVQALHAAPLWRYFALKHS